METKKFSIPEDNSETIYLSIVFSWAETQSENLYFGDPEANNEIFSFSIDFSIDFRNSNTINFISSEVVAAKQKFRCVRNYCFQ